MQDSSGLAYNEKVRQKCEKLYNAGCRVNHLLACIIDICQERPITDESPDSIFHINNALKVLLFLLAYINELVLINITYNCIYNYNHSCVKNYLRNMIR